MGIEEELIEYDALLNRIKRSPVTTDFRRQITRVFDLLFSVWEGNINLSDEGRRRYSKIVRFVYEHLEEDKSRYEHILRLIRESRYGEENLPEYERGDARAMIIESFVRRYDRLNKPKKRKPKAATNKHYRGEIISELPYLGEDLNVLSEKDPETLKELLKEKKRGDNSTKPKPTS